MAQKGITTDAATFKRQTRELARLTGRNVSQVMEHQVGIVGAALMRAFPPKTKGVGKRALENDLKKIIFPMEEISTLTRWQDSLEGVHDVFDDSGVRIEDWHEKHRSKRTGRTKNISGSRQQAGRKFSNKLHVSKKHFNQYVRRRSKKIGDLKSGWEPTAKLNSSARIPAWVGGQAKLGYTRNKMKNDTGNGSIIFVNSVKYASRWKRQNDFVMRQNGKRMVRALKAEYRKSIKQATAGAK